MTDNLPEGWEAWLAYFSASLPQPVEQVASPDGGITFRAGDPGEVIVHLTSNLITVSMFRMQWARPHEPLVVARPVGHLRWQRMLPDDATRVVEALVDAARASRAATFRICAYCDHRLPPEYMHDERTCESCAAQARGLVH